MWIKLEKKDFTCVINKPSKNTLLSSRFFRRISSTLRIGSLFSSSSGSST
jgi:hypothetical protein